MVNESRAVGVTGHTRVGAGGYCEWLPRSVTRDWTSDTASGPRAAPSRRRGLSVGRVAMYPTRTGGAKPGGLNRPLALPHTF